MHQTTSLTDNGFYKILHISKASFLLAVRQPFICSYGKLYFVNCFQSFHWLKWFSNLFLVAIKDGLALDKTVGGKVETPIATTKLTLAILPLNEKYGVCNGICYIKLYYYVINDWYTLL